MKIVNRDIVEKVLGAKKSGLKIVERFPSRGEISVSSDDLPGVTVKIVLTKNEVQELTTGSTVAIDGGVLKVTARVEAPAPSGTSRGCASAADIIR